MWRAIIALLDWRTFIRRVKGCPVVDVVFISNLRDEIDRKRYVGYIDPRCGHFNANRFWFGDVSGRVRVINSTASDILTIKGRKKAQAQFISAVEWASKKGVKVILFAATTKRLFPSEKMEQLKVEFPNIIFTIGDSGTGFSLQNDTIRAFKMSNIVEKSRIAILGPSGFLGGMMARHLKKLGYSVVGLGSDKARLDKVGQDIGIETCTDFSDLGIVNSVIACTHSEKASLDPDIIDKIRKSDEKLVVIDVAEPKNLSEEEYKCCQDRVILFHAGDPYSRNLRYVGGIMSYKMLRLSKGVIFGCFAEALVIAYCIKHDQMVNEINSTNWLTVSDESMSLVSKLFDGKFGLGKPRCFTKEVKSFHKILPSVAG
jgi:predicted amino acid dehydrogenase